MSIAFTSLVSAQDLTPANEPPLTDASPENEGLLREPDAIQRAVVTVDRRFNSGEATEDPRAVFGNMVPGAGWLSVGAGYRRWYARDHIFLDGSGLLGSLTDQQWQDAFQAGGYDPQTANRFIDVLRKKIRAGEKLPSS